MSSVGVGYDLSTHTYSPAGRVFQVEYAQKAVDASGTVVGIQCKDGVVLAVEKIVPQKMLVKGTGRRVFSGAKHVGMAAAGFLPDIRYMAGKLQEECNNYKDFYNIPMPGHVLSDRISLLASQRTEFWAYRVLGCSMLIATYDESGGPRLFMIDGAGENYQYRGVAVGKGRQTAKVKLEKIDFESITCREAANELGKIIYSVHDDVKDKPFELEMSWICEESKWQHRKVPAEILEAANAAGKAAADEDSDGGDDDDDDDDDEE